MGLMAWFNTDPDIYTQERNMNKKEHTEIIDLVKTEHKSPLDGVVITYEDHKNLEKLSLYLKVFLNGKHIGNIVVEPSSRSQSFKFESMSAICQNFYEKQVSAVKDLIETHINTIVKCFKEWE